LSAFSAISLLPIERNLNGLDLQLAFGVICGVNALS
jgi:hypothetical protein